MGERNYDVLIPTTPEREPSLTIALSGLLIQHTRPNLICISLHRLRWKQNQQLVQLLRNLGVVVVLEGGFDHDRDGVNQKLQKMYDYHVCSPYVVAMDDDVLFKSTTLFHWKRGLDTQLGAMISGIQLLQNHESSPVPADYTDQSFDFHPPPAVYNKHSGGGRCEKTQFNRTIITKFSPADCIINSYMIARHWLDEVEGWDTVNLKTIGGEIDLSLRIREAGGLVMIWSGEFYHLRAPVRRDVDRYERENEQAQSYLERRHPDVLAL